MVFKQFLCVVVLWMMSGLGYAEDPENMISPLSYHLCEYTVTKNVTKMIPFQKQHKTKMLCGGWIPWRMCPRTYYKTEYYSVDVPETTQVQKCCEGYENVGHYCAASSGRFSEFARRPGTCHSNPRDQMGPKCTSDLDCPGLQKCCFSNNSFCVSPVPQDLDRNTIKYWYNGIFTVKAEFDALRQIDPGFYNHSRLLHSMITGELCSLEVSFNFLSTEPASMFTVQSHLLIGINQSHSLDDIRMKMNNIVIQIPEVISITIKDMDECLHPELNSCLPNQICTNINGTYTCTDIHPTYPPNVTKECSMFTNQIISNVTAGGFQIHWGTDCPENSTYRVHVSAMNGFNYTNVTRVTYMNISGLEAGELYIVNVSFLCSNGQHQIWTASVKTDAQILNGTLRITNQNLTEVLLNKSSEEYLNFVKTFVEEVKKSMSKDIPAEMLNVKVESLTAGSIVVNFYIIVNDTTWLNNVTSSSFVPMINSTVFAIDPESIVITDFNECLSPLNNDCDKNAECKNLNVSYTCQCVKPYVDTNGARPGRSCETTNDSLLLSTKNPYQHSDVPTFSTYSVTKVDVPEESSTVLPIPRLVTQEKEMKTSVPPIHSISISELNTMSDSLTGNHTLTTSNTSLLITDPIIHREDMKTSSSDNSSNTGELNATTEFPMHFTKEFHRHESSSTDTIPTINKNNNTSSSGPTVRNTSVIHIHSDATTAHATSQPLIVTTKDGNIVPTTAKPVTTKIIIAESPPKVQADPSLKDSSNITCEAGVIGITILKSYLQMMSFPESSLYLGNPVCNVINSTNTIVLLQTRWDDCGTDMRIINNQTVVNTTLYTRVSSVFPNLIRSAKPIGSVRCAFKNEILVSTGYNPPEGFQTVIESLEGDGTFISEFQLFNGDQPLTQNLTLSPSDDVKIQIRVKTEDPKFKAVISDCWATPSPSSEDSVSFPFIRDRCALENTFTVVHTNGESNNASFQTKLFSFVRNPIVYIHCRLHVCKESVPGSCKPSCSYFRTARSDGNVFTSVTRMGPLRRGNQPHVPEPATEPHLGPGYIALIIVAIFAFVAGVVAILVCWHERRTGNYNFKLKSKDVGYQVFFN
ncbi:uromodulin-like 1 [Pelobates fuscus]|uniref:uromodulin-like 1 n=1 Tax=Pelobates fuscus TaxID=191477 RepID=UPI002FE4A6B8